MPMPSPSLHQPGVVSVFHEVGGGLEVEFVEDVAFVCFHGAAAQAEVVGDLLGRQTVGAQLDDFQFACREVGFCADAVLLVFVATIDAEQAIEFCLQGFWINVLAQITIHKTLGAGYDLRVLVFARKQNNFDIGAASPRMTNHIDTVSVGKEVVKQNQIHLVAVLVEIAFGSPHIVGFGHNDTAQARVVERHADAHAIQRMVFHQEDSDRGAVGHRVAFIDLRCETSGRGTAKPSIALRCVVLRH